MIERPAVLLCSHGKFAEAALESLELIIGKQNNCAAVGLSVDTNVEKFEKDMIYEIDKLDSKYGVVIFTDIIGGTPSNVIMRLIYEREDVISFSGFNLPVLIEVFLSTGRSLSELKKIIVDTFKVSFTDLTELIKEGEELEDGNSIL